MIYGQLLEGFRLMGKCLWFLQLATMCHLFDCALQTFRKNSLASLFILTKKCFYQSCEFIHAFYMTLF